MKEVLSMPIKGKILNIPIDELELSVRASNVLANAGIITVSDFILFGPEKLCRVKNAGKKTIYEIGNAILSKLHENKEKLSPETQCILFETDSSEETFEEMMKNSFTEKMLNTPIEELRLSTRTINALERANLKTIKDIVDFGLHALQKRKNVGRKAIDEIKTAIVLIQKAQIQSTEEISFVDALDSIFISITLKHLPIIKARFGYDDGKCRTLEEIGNKVGITRERVRQIILKGLRQIKHFKGRKDLRALVENIERLLLHYKGIVSIRDMTSDAYFASGTKNQLIFLINLFSDLYENRYRILFKRFLTSISDDEIKILHSKIREASLKCQFPIDERFFVENIISSIGNISQDYLIHHLLHQEHIEVLKGKVLSPGRLSVPQKVKLLMRNIDEPMHFTEIAKLYKSHFGDLKITTKDIEHAIHTRISNSTDFIIVNPGTFILRNKFRIPDNIDEIVKISREILWSLGNISDTRYLINELKRRGISTGNLNAYSLKTILLEYPGFVSYRKFEIGIENLADECERKSLGDLIFEVLLSTSKPMHVKTIWKELQKKRGFPEYAIAQRLAVEPRFIRVAPATYTVAKNIAQYKEKQKIIIDFAKEWIKSKGTAISAFFVSEVLKETEEIKDFPLGLVEHVLSESPEFVKLPNAFYNLANGEI